MILKTDRDIRTYIVFKIKILIKYKMKRNFRIFQILPAELTLFSSSAVKLYIALLAFALS